MISAIVCTYNREKYIYNVLKSLAGCGLDPKEYEIVLVDNNCTDGTAAEAARFGADFPQVAFKYAKEPRQGLSHARNRGIAEAAGDIVVFVDDDAFVGPGYLQTYAAFFAHHPEIDAAGGPIIPEYEDASEPEWMTYFTKRLITGYLYFGDKPKEFPGKEYPGGGNAAYRRTVFDKVGLYNPELGRNGDSLTGGEEKDIFRKMSAAGMRFWYLPDAVLHHIIPARKLQPEYFDALTLGIGRSERRRTMAAGGAAYAGRLAAEGVKWCATIVLWIGNCLKGNKKAADKLVAFRRNVTRGLLGKS